MDCTGIKVGDWVGTLSRYSGKLGSCLHQVSRVTAKRFYVVGDTVEIATGKTVGGGTYWKLATQEEVDAFHAANAKRVTDEAAKEAYDAREDVKLARRISYAETDQFLRLGVDELRRIVALLEAQREQAKD